MQTVHTDNNNEDACTMLYTTWHMQHSTVYLSVCINAVDLVTVGATTVHVEPITVEAATVGPVTIT